MTGSSNVSSAQIQYDCRVAIYKSIVEELIDNAILELSFEVHREVKLKLIQIIPTLQDKSTSIKGKTSKPNQSFQCLSCGQNKGPMKFAVHMHTCMEGSSTNEKSRAAKNKLKNFKELSDDDDDDDKKNVNSKKGKKKQRSVGKSQSRANCDSAQSYLNMSNDELKALFNQHCGVRTKQSKKLCSNSLKCSQHTEIERIAVRDDLLRDESDNGQIDVDTVKKMDIKTFNPIGNVPENVNSKKGKKKQRSVGKSQSRANCDSAQSNLNMSNDNSSRTLEYL